MNQDQYHASLLNSGQPVGLGWDGVTKASQPKIYPMEPPNDTDVDATIKQVRDDDSTLIDLNWNNIKVWIILVLAKTVTLVSRVAQSTYLCVEWCFLAEYLGREIHAIVRGFGNEHASGIAEFDQRRPQRQDRATASWRFGEEFDA